MRIAFFGSGAFGLPTLEVLHARHTLVAVVTQPDRTSGRKMKLTPTPVGQWAEAQGVTVYKQEDVNTPGFVATVSDLQLDASVVIAFGQKLCPELIAAMGALAVNLHGSLLPAYRGAAPVQRAVMAGDATTGVSVIGLAQRMDAGAVYATASLDIGPTDTAGDMHDRLAALGPAAVMSVLEKLEAGALSPMEQEEAEATRAPKLKKADGTTGFSGAASVVRARINGLNPWPGCRVRWWPAGDGSGEAKPLLIRRVVEEAESFEVGGAGDADAPAGTVLAGLRVATGAVGGAVGGAGVVRLLALQAPGTRVLPAEAFAAGHGLGVGDRLGEWPG